MTPPSPRGGRGASPHLGEDGRPARSGAGNTYIGAMPPGSRANTMTVKDQARPVPPFSRRPPMNVDLARIQFAFTSINHFFFVPVTIGLAFLTGTDSQHRYGGNCHGRKTLRRAGDLRGHRR